MYCPSCGQQQVSDEMRYCSRCGLALTGLLEWLAGGRVPLRAAEEAQVVPDSRRRKHMRRAGKLMFFAGALFPIFVLISIAADEPGPLVVPFFIFFVSLAWMLYARLFMPTTATVKHQSAVQMPPASDLDLRPRSSARLTTARGRHASLAGSPTSPDQRTRPTSQRHRTHHSTARQRVTHGAQVIAGPQTLQPDSVSAQTLSRP
jgi:hypothetical protein